MKLINADQMISDESEAYMSVQTRDDVDEITKNINTIVHTKIQRLIAETPEVKAIPVNWIKKWVRKVKKQKGREATAQAVDVMLTEWLEDND